MALWQSGKLKGANMDFFTSDLHIGHAQSFIWQKRGFSSIEEHDTTILRNWNSTVSPYDNVYILGDLCMNSDEKEWNRIFKLLYGKKYFIIGNHDTDNKILKYEDDYNITNLGYGYVYKYNKKWQFFLSHYPTFTSSLSDTTHYPLVNLYGHTHQNTNFFNENNPYMYHVGVDSHNCFPISIEQIIIDIEKKKTECEKRGSF